MPPVRVAHLAPVCEAPGFGRRRCCRRRRVPSRRPPPLATAAKVERLLRLDEREALRAELIAGSHKAALGGSLHAEHRCRLAQQSRMRLCAPDHDARLRANPAQVYPKSLELLWRWQRRGRWLSKSVELLWLLPGIEPIPEWLIHPGVGLPPVPLDLGHKEVLGT